MTYNIEIKSESLSKLNRKIRLWEREAAKITGIESVKINILFPSGNKVTIEKVSLSLNKICNITSFVTGIPSESIRGIGGKDKRKKIIDAKKHFVSICFKTKQGITLQSIGEFLSLHHATVMNLRDRADDLLQTDRHFALLNDKIYNEYISS